MKTTYLLAAIPLLVLSPFLSDRSKGQDHTVLVKLSDDFKPNGKGDNRQWNKATWVLLPQRREGGSQYKTQAKILYSTTGIYLLFLCSDAHITSTIKEDFSDLWKEDVVEVFFWTDANYPFYFEYEISPNNFELPILVPNVQGSFLGWRPWHYQGERKTRHATSIQQENGQVTSWTAEFFIPFTLLKPMSNVPPKSGTRWRANMYRMDYDKGVSTWTWQPIRTTFHDIDKFGTFIFE